MLIPDELVITSRLMERWVLENGFGGRILVYSGILRSLEEKLRRGDEAGVNAFKSLREACERTGAVMEIVDVGDGAEDLRTALRELAQRSGGELVTSDPVTAKLCEALSIRFRYLAPESILELDKIFQGNVMSLHLKESVPPRVKKGVPGAWRFEEISERPMSREELELVVAQIMLEVYSTLGRGSFIEVEKRDTMIVQLRDYRVVITRPPLSDGLEVTIVRPIVRKSLEDYELHPSLMERLVEKAEGILVAGPPGMGKSTFAQALAEHYRSLGMVVKTIESPRDLQLSSDITQYSKSAATHGELHDVLLLSRPDYTVFDEMRDTDDFKIYIDLRLAGIGMVGVIHATTPIDAIQRVAQRLDIGVIPSVIDTVIFMDKGEVSKIYTLEVVVKVPRGLRKADLARPTVLVKDFLTGEVEYELYVFGERTFIVPAGEVGGRLENEADNKVTDIASTILGKFIRGYRVKVKGDQLRIEIPPEYMKVYVKKCQRKIYRLCREMNLALDVVVLNSE
ncbi:MAG: ATPase, T2SS/T4P/T4SS family [Nitrososphaerota archaeon]|nr:ATPase, T2SS/T4P/T4SS family [Nitrososphaerota archaeon]